MTGTSHKSNRSEFLRSIKIVWPTNHLREAHLDLWGAVLLVAVIGMCAKLIQTLIMN